MGCILCSRVAHCEIDGAVNGASVEPAISVDSDGLTCEIAEMSGLLD